MAKHPPTKPSQLATYVGCNWNLGGPLPGVTYVVTDWKPETVDLRVYGKCRVRELIGPFVRINNGRDWYLAKDFERVDAPRPKLTITSLSAADIQGFRAKCDIRAFQIVGFDEVEPLVSRPAPRPLLREYDRLDDDGKWSIDIETDPFVTVLAKSSQTGLTEYRRFEQRLLDLAAASSNMTCAQVCADYDAAKRASDYADARRYAHTASWWLRNSTYGKFGKLGDRGGRTDGIRIPELFPGDDFSFASTPRLYPFDGFNYLPMSVPYIDPIKEPNDMSIIPPLSVPEAPKPEVTPAAPESASVQMLRKLLEQRQGELEAFTASKESDEKFAVNLEAKLERVREAIAGHGRGIAAAKQAIEEIEVDIALLKGSTASVKVETDPDLNWITWSGGANPVPGLVVEIKPRRGSGKLMAKSDILVWTHTNKSDDIMAYRIVEKS